MTKKTDEKEVTVRRYYFMRLLSLVTGAAI